jgi:putative hemolysin
MYCASKGGTVTLRSEGGGQVGYCTLPNGTVVEEWTLYRAENPGVDP